MGDQTAKSRLLKVQVTESQFADDLVLYAVTRTAYESICRGFVQVESFYGLTVSLPKTKGLILGVTVGEGDDSPVVVAGGEMEMERAFTYLGSELSGDGEITAEVSCRIAKASKALGCLRIPIFLHCSLSIHTKRAVFKAVVISVLLCGVETWTLKATDVRKLATFHNHCVHTILNSTSGRIILLVNSCLDNSACIGQ